MEKELKELDEAERLNYCQWFEFIEERGFFS
jgi:hypothetical protein